MTTETKVLAGIGVITVGILTAGIFLLSKPVPADLSGARQVNSEILVKIDSSQTGPTDAKVTLVEFGDFQCPACAQTQPVVNKLKEEYKGKVNFVFRHYPLPQHKNAVIAAQAAESAGEQKKFWEMHDALYENLSEWAEVDKPLNIFIKYARELSLNVDQFKKSVESEKYKSKVLKDEQDGGAAQIRYTPTFFINGRIIEGSATYDTLRGGIETELNK
jgi:protein-disulfide isomerase